MAFVRLHHSLAPRLAVRRSPPPPCAADFDAWLAAHPLPKRGLASSTDLSDISNASTTEEERFHWGDLPTVLSRFQGIEWRHSSKSPGTFLGHNAPDNDPVCVLRLPRVMLHTVQGTQEGTGLPSPLLSPAVLGVQAMVLLSADSVALGLWNEEDELIKSKVLTGYTVRRSQGKAQLTHLRQGGGGGSVGGALRAREARRLFQAGASKLHEWSGDLAMATALFRGGGIRAWNELYAATAPAVPVARDDPRWCAVGVGVRRPRLADLQAVRETLRYGTVRTLAGDSEVDRIKT